ncbi:MAG: hypothetical protein V2A54_00635, partial [Bacteroidota bacterium]
TDSMLSKTQVLKSIRNLPDEFTVEEIIDRIILLQKIDIGDEQSINGKVLSTSEAKTKLKKWLK